MEHTTGFVLIGYDVFPATLVRRNKKTITVDVAPHKWHVAHRRTVKPEKFVDGSKPFCVVWELWRGVPGQGTYRLDTTLYTNHHRLGWHDGRVTEEKDPSGA